jgi:hypothetical protein
VLYLKIKFDIVIILDKQFAECDDEFDVENDNNSDDYDESLNGRNDYKIRTK